MRQSRQYTCGVRAIAGKFERTIVNVLAGGRVEGGRDRAWPDVFHRGRVMQLAPPLNDVRFFNCRSQRTSLCIGLEWTAPYWAGLERAISRKIWL